ncbi:MAG: class I SAM-dependent methyltransferase [Nocardioidaceae bacterium]
MRYHKRALVDQALHEARLSAYPGGEFADQESFMRASEILSLAVRAGVAPGTAVLDLCCGVAGPGRLITRELGCTYTGVDQSPGSIDVARDRAGDLACRFEVARIPPVPAGRFDVVLLLETMLAFPDKEALLGEISPALCAGGRFAFTLEEGQPLTEPERERMPEAHTVWLIPLAEMLSCLERVGLRVRWYDELSQSHLATVDALAGEFTANAAQITAHVGRRGLDDMLTSHRLWSSWLREGRVRKFAIVAEKAR